MAFSLPRLRRRRRSYPVGEDGLIRMSLRDHLAELRRRVLIAAAAVVAGSIAGFVVYDRVLGFMTGPYCELKQDRVGPGSTCNLVITDPLDGLTTHLKVAIYVGFVLALPVVLYQLWRFVTPGLHPKEKRYAIPFILSSLLLFALGAVIAVFTFPQALSFLIVVSGEQVEPLFSPGKYISLYLLIMLAFGVAFEFPVVLVFLQMVGVLNPRQLMGRWRMAVIGIFVFAAVITPSQDPISMLGMALPLVLFYFASAGIGRFVLRR